MARTVTPFHDEQRPTTSETACAMPRNQTRHLTARPSPGHPLEPPVRGRDRGEALAFEQIFDDAAEDFFIGRDRVA